MQHKNNKIIYSYDVSYLIKISHFILTLVKYTNS
jgi:hypothetical protein